MNASLRLIQPKRLTFHLTVYPLPLSRCFNNAAKNGRYDSPDYKAWKIEADWSVKMACKGWLGSPGKPTFDGPCSVLITVKKRDRRQADLDNLLKSALDLLQRNHIVADDSQIYDLRIKWGTEMMPHPIHYEIQELAGGEIK